MTTSSDNIYGSSKIDWHELRKLAARVARESGRKRAVVVETGAEPTQKVIRGFLGSRKVVREMKPFSREKELDYWILDDRFFRKQRRVDAQNSSTEVQRYHYCLNRDGRLFVQVDSFEEYEGPNYRGYYQETTHVITEYDFTDDTVELLDFERGYRASTEGEPKVFTNNIPGTRRLAISRGGGLNLNPPMGDGLGSAR